MVKFAEFIMILGLHRRGLKVAAIARQLGRADLTSDYVSLQKSSHAISPFCPTGADGLQPLGTIQYSAGQLYHLTLWSIRTAGKTPQAV